MAPIYLNQPMINKDDGHDHDDPRETHFTNLHDHHNKVREYIFSSRFSPVSDDRKQEPEIRTQINSCSVECDKMISSSSDRTTNIDDDKPETTMKIKRPLENDHRTNIRVCSDCNTTTTPLWRSGPHGPKSLCNACGIRQRKARKAMVESENGVVSSNNNKEKKARTIKNCNKKNQFLEDFGVRFSSDSTPFPRDEEEAAFLLMYMSSGFL